MKKLLFTLLATCALTSAKADALSPYESAFLGPWGLRPFLVSHI